MKADRRVMPERRPDRWRRAAVGLTAALVLHAAALGALDAAPSAPAALPASRAPVVVRLVATEPVPDRVLPRPADAPSVSPGEATPERTDRAPKRPEPLAAAPRAARAAAARHVADARPAPPAPAPAPTRTARPARGSSADLIGEGDIGTGREAPPGGMTVAPPRPVLPPDSATPATASTVPTDPTDPAEPTAASARLAGTDARRPTARLLPVVDRASTAPAGQDSPTRAEPDPETEAIPRYPTRPPPSVGLRYDVRRGGLSGVGRIDWRQDGNHYDLTLEFRYAGLLLLEQSSSGGFDAEGIAPVRFLDRRIRRAAQAANFQREAHRLTYSGSANDYALRPGAQDRLSWMIQLAAIVSADPSLARPGGRVTMFVTGARGDVAVWTFRCAGTEPLDLRNGRIETVRFVREARGEHDISVQAWLDPARHYLPAGASQQSGPDDEPYELRLLDAS